MNKFLILFYSGVFLFGCTSNSIEPKMINVDSAFLNWNLSIIKVLNCHIKSVRDSSERQDYENRLEAFMASIGIDKPNTINKRSIRYDFLQTIVEFISAQPEFYIIESDKSGERVLIQTFLVKVKGNNLNVSLFEFNDSKWIKKNDSKNIHLNIKGRLKDEKTILGSGYNEDDVIVTHFLNNQIVDSEFYLYASISNESWLKKIIN
jgi:hypothetical protein